MIWGVGYATKKKAEEKLNITTIGDLQPHPKPTLVKVFGPAMGEKLYKAAKGLDDSKLQPDQRRKSVSAEINASSSHDAQASQLTICSLGSGSRRMIRQPFSRGSWGKKWHLDSRPSI
jgi:nucleotidyltransferase/DNA polymerase involved in DNA repair